VNHALKRGSRGLQKGVSLAFLLSVERGVRSHVAIPPLSIKQIMTWARAHHRRTGDWPIVDSGDIPGAPGETWARVDNALRQGDRGLPGGSSLARLLSERGKKRNPQGLPPLTYKQILLWADEHHRLTGDWPNANSGPIADTVGERWDLIDAALRVGNRGLPGGSSLIRLLAKKRGLRNPASLPPLTVEEVLRWAAMHFAQTGAWPHDKSGTITAAPEETWCGLDNALRRGKRGLPGRSSLAKLLAVHRGVGRHAAKLSQGLANPQVNAPTAGGELSESGVPLS
jgi:hypothetical protein